ncbi:MAG: hypothetical protein HY820_17060, partial [Acidobacteria bacterium]|nr:hypothetical protein [Acidobacteriota bacterium]
DVASTTPLSQQHPHSLSVLARLRDVVKAMKDTEAFKATLAAKNEPNSLETLLTALKARAEQSETKPNS